MGITLHSLGAAEEVTGSKHIFEIGGRQFMVDCGAFQGRRTVSNKKNHEFSADSEKLEAVIMTHGHYDHCGLLPMLIKQGFSGSIYSTPATRDIMNLVLMDSARIQARDAEYLAKQAARRGEKFDWSPLFTEKDCVKTANQMISLPYNRRMYIAPNVQLEFFDAGHILGSAFASFTIRGSRGGIYSPQSAEKDKVRILYTGDIGRRDKPIIRDPATDMPPPDYIFLESTYGDRVHENSEFAMRELERVVCDAVERRGKIIIPSFAIERAQELVFFLHLLTDMKRIPPIPIYVDSPMASNVTSVFRVHQECYDESVIEAFLDHHKNPFGFGSLSFTTSVEESKELNNKEGPMIIISADGMCEAGRILYHLANEIGKAQNTILIVGYMAENTLGRKICDGEKEVRILGDMYRVNARIEKIDAFSAHADYMEMTRWLDAIDTSRLKNIFLVHGEKGAQEFFMSHLNRHGYKNVSVVKYGETYEVG